jgi:sec-independent protein translocase protein TatA
MGLSIGHLVLVLLIVLVIFGSKRVPEIMKDLAKGYRSFTDGIKERDAKDRSDQLAPDKPSAKDIRLDEKQYKKE